MDRIKELEDRVKDLLNDNERYQIEAAQATRAAEKMAIESHLRIAVMLDGRARDEKAAEDIVQRALNSGQWKVDSKGRLIRHQDGIDDMDADGNPVTPRVWLKSAANEMKHLLRDPTPEVSSGHNPWTREHWSLTEQGKIARDPNNGLARAEQMAKAAGSHLGATRPPATQA